MSFTERLAGRARGISASLAPAIQHPLSELDTGLTLADVESFAEQNAGHYTEQSTQSSPDSVRPSSYRIQERPLHSSPDVSVRGLQTPTPAEPARTTPLRTPFDSVPRARTVTHQSPRGDRDAAWPEANATESRPPPVVRELTREVHTHERLVERHHTRTAERTERVTLNKVNTVRAVQRAEPPLPVPVPASVAKNAVATASTSAVHVHIGRIVVGAEPKRVVPAPRVRAPSSAIKTLAEHLSQRGRSRQ